MDELVFMFATKALAAVMLLFGSIVMGIYALQIIGSLYAVIKYGRKEKPDWYKGFLPNHLKEIKAHVDDSRYLGAVLGTVVFISFWYMVLVVFELLVFGGRQ